MVPEHRSARSPFGLDEPPWVPDKEVRGGAGGSLSLRALRAVCGAPSGVKRGVPLRVA